MERNHSREILANIYLFKVNKKNPTRMALDVSLIFLLLTLNIFHTFYSVSIVGFEQVNVSWDVLFFCIIYF